MFCRRDVIILYATIFFIYVLVLYMFKCHTLTCTLTCILRANKILNFHCCLKRKSVKRHTWVNQLLKHTINPIFFFIIIFYLYYAKCIYKSKSGFRCIKIYLEQRNCYCPGSSEEQTIFLKTGYIWFRMHLEFWKNHKEYRQTHTFLA